MGEKNPSLSDVNVISIFFFFAFSSLLSSSLKATYKRISGYTEHIKNTLDAFNIQSVHAALRGVNELN